MNIKQKINKLGKFDLSNNDIKLKSKITELLRLTGFANKDELKDERERI